MNTTGQVGSIFSPLITGWIVQRFANWQMPLLIMAGLYAVSAVLWTQVDPLKRLTARPPAA
jgi:MFS family permease